MPRPEPLRAVVLFSGGLDSMLAVRLLQRQGVEVEALNFRTQFTCCQGEAARMAHRLGVRLSVLAQEEDYLELVRRPRFGYGKGANPCIDCRIYMFQRAKRYMEESGAHFVASGEVLGQRPKSQKRRDLEAIAIHAGLEELLLRPLSARRLPETLPERAGWIDRRALGDFVGRSRKGLIALARELALPEIPSPSTGCQLTEVGFAAKVHDLLRFDPPAGSWDFELLKVGRHFRLDERTKVIVGRREEENGALAALYREAPAGAGALLTPAGFTGPTALLVGRAGEAELAFALGLVHRYSRARHDDGPPGTVVVETSEGSRLRQAAPHPRAEQAATVAE